MIGYVTLGTNDISKAAQFYDSLFEVLGGKRLMESDSFIAWGIEPDQPYVCVTEPFNGEPAAVGNGVMIALMVDSTDKVDEAYQKAIELGAQDEGPAGPRDDIDGFYAGYFRDLDGNKLNVFHMPSP
ncbi:VOC family protein [Acaryochloris sp. IP29b_bin.137]|uniref:VOC family protein n=1 Tax=Acaryochloris sp. IP29b_bin.137 TaxID=2969217 RepID=UPI002617B699|nr:VOC family protein [Acaryochloris sp. IP29b_bin.137]